MTLSFPTWSPTHTGCLIISEGLPKCTHRTNVMYLPPQNTNCPQSVPKICHSAIKVKLVFVDKRTRPLRKKDGVGGGADQRTETGQDLGTGRHKRSQARDRGIIPATNCPCKNGEKGTGGGTRAKPRQSSPQWRGLQSKPRCALATRVGSSFLHTGTPSASFPLANPKDVGDPLAFGVSRKNFKSPHPSQFSDLEMVSKPWNFLGLRIPISLLSPPLSSLAPQSINPQTVVLQELHRSV